MTRINTIGGVLVQGHWTDDGRYMHWCPLPRMPKKEKTE